THQLLRDHRHRRGYLPRRPPIYHVEHTVPGARGARHRHPAPAHADLDGGERPCQRDQDERAVDPARGGDEVVLAREQGRGRLRRRILEARGEGLMDFVLGRPVVIALAVAGAVLSTAASMLRSRGRLSERAARSLNYAGYA